MTTIIEKLNELQKEILGNLSDNWNAENSKIIFREYIRKQYGFEKEFGWNIILNAYYIIDDTELAKLSFYEFGLQGPSRHDDVGEKYLRLYGILNSVYQQKLAIENLMEVHKIRQSREYSKYLTENELIVLRNKIAAHSANYKLVKGDSEHKFDLYEISRIDLQGDKIKIHRNQKDIESYDIDKSLKEFDKLTENILSEIVGKLIKRIYKNQGKIYNEYQKINKMKDGAVQFGDMIFELANHNSKLV